MDEIDASLEIDYAISLTIDHRFSSKLKISIPPELSLIMNAKVGDTLDLSTIDIVADVLGTPPVNSTSNAKCRSQDLLDTTCE
jgi:hypothetical protein